MAARRAQPGTRSLGRLRDALEPGAAVLLVDVALSRGVRGEVLATEVAPPPLTMLRATGLASVSVCRKSDRAAPEPPQSADQGRAITRTPNVASRGARRSTYRRLRIHVRLRERCRFVRLVAASRSTGTVDRYASRPNVAGRVARHKT
jgi:hypothetical protein